jgi:hypothetical protein
VPTPYTEGPIQIEGRRKRWSRSEFDVLAARGILDRWQVELIGAEIIQKEHKIAAAHQMYVWLSGVFGPRVIATESQIHVSPEDNPTNEPEPDLMVLSRDKSEFIYANPSRRICNS